MDESPGRESPRENFRENGKSIGTELDRQRELKISLKSPGQISPWPYHFISYRRKSVDNLVEIQNTFVPSKVTLKGFNT